jgi:hypothetical protein
MNFIDTKAKCRHLNKITCKGTLRQVFICLIPPPPLPRYTLYTVRQYVLYVHVLIQYGRLGEREPERRLELGRIPT